ncbi:MAG: DUF2723 domain-containing protein [Acidobacteriota bacterium]
MSASPAEPRRSRVLSHPLSQAGAIFFGTLTVYALGVCRTIYVGDSGELVAAVATLGIPHPSGYPLYVLLGKLWTLLVPIGSIALRMSLFSATMAAAANGLLYAILRRAGLSWIAALGASLILAFGPSYWSQANIQRVYSLGALFLVAVIGLAWEWYRSRQIRYMVTAAFVTGMGAANHTVMGVIGLAIGLFALISEPALLRRWRHLTACVAAGVVGLWPYLYLPLRSRQNPRLDWGNPETWDGFVGVVTRRDFWDRAWLETPADALVILADFLRSLGHELMWGGTALALAGAVWGRRRGWPVLLPLLVMVANVWVVGMHGSRSDIFIWHRYYIPAYAMAALLAAFGVQLIVERWGRRWGAATLLIPLALLAVGYPKFDRSRFRVADDFSRQLLASLPPGAHLAASDDNILFVLIYLHLVEGLRPDLDLIMQGVGDAELPPLRFDPDTDPLYFTHHPNWDLPAIEVVPVGLAFRTVRAGGPPPEVTLPTAELAGAKDPRVPKDYLTRNLIGHFHYMLGITHEIRDWPRAAAEFERATAIASENDVLFYNLGLIYRRNGLLDRSLAAFERSREINPRHIASKRQVQATDRIGEVRAELERLARVEQQLAATEPLSGLVEGQAEYHRRLSRLLAARGEAPAARGHLLRALETE